MGVADQLAQMKAEKAAANLKAGEDFLEQNKTRPELTTLDSGLQYQVLTAAEGDKPGVEDTVTVHYEGRLLNGEVFDSSITRGQPATFPLNRVIAGWTEGVQLMPVGSKYKLWIPAKLGYGEQGTPGGPIPPNATLVFEVELLEIVKQ